MKQTKCPNGKHSGCWDYGSCEDCPIGIMIERYEKKVKRLKSENETLTLKNKILKNEKKQAVKEFAEKLKENYFLVLGKEICSDVDAEYIGFIIDELLKEYKE